MISADAGETVNVIGSSKAIASAGPIPGRTPTKVPRNVPSNPNPILTGVIAAIKPLIKESRLSIIEM
jgi:hypothetical protein